MTSKNLALAFGPTLLGPNLFTSFDGIAQEFRRLDFYMDITELLIEYAPEIFMDED